MMNDDDGGDCEMVLIRVCDGVRTSSLIFFPNS